MPALRRRPEVPMPTLLLNKPYGVLCQFTGEPGQRTLKEFVPVADVYPAGRLDADSEGLVVLTDDGALQARLSHPRHKLPKTYWVQVEGSVGQAALDRLCRGIAFSDFTTQPAQAREIEAPPQLWPPSQRCDQPKVRNGPTSSAGDWSWHVRTNRLAGY